MRRLQILQLAHQPVEFAVGDFRPGLHVVQPVVPLQLPAQDFRALPRFGQILCRLIHRFHLYAVLPFGSKPNLGVSVIGY